MLLKWNEHDKETLKQMANILYNNVRDLEIIKLFNRVDDHNEWGEPEDDWGCGDDR